MTDTHSQDITSQNDQTQAPQRTPFYQSHIDSEGKLVDFSGWELPIHYGSQIEEHDAVRTDAGMFDVSHMVVTDIKGADTKAWLQKLLANDVNKLTTAGKALYSGMLNEQGGVIDDLIVYLMNAEETEYRIVSNAATRDKDLAQFNKVAEGFDITITERPELAMLAVQGPNAIAKLAQAKPSWADTLAALKPFVGADLTDIEGTDWFVARTGYTGEDGVEVIMHADDAPAFFEQLKANGIKPAGLGARDTLRMEAGMNLYGHDMDETISPYECNMGWTLALKDDRAFVGREALVSKRKQSKEDNTAMKQVGLLLTTRGVLREGMTVTINQGTDNEQTGIITSGTFSPSLKNSIAIARVPTSLSEDNSVQVDLRGKGKFVDVRVLKLPFVRNGKQQFDS
ncbi:MULTISPECIES: glycine cleavage system aminomethyltransferase GcvT [Psychrobacter]|uniref:glycine cleavage system aminomethyltransferase GcvT n=1 Tax=Psychrobacter TaxID=497 RepID=UPI0008695829|nr:MULTISPECIES: glycine cleavage system aminomethyltransferase GcvT [Psychrobacter]MBA6244167.1 glycine cleavage system aminomethyltransferase GcvT [Psychrobacter sp. Urea-trap-18]MBA6285253.1 glycine cleavage system aminomethyltransferase GcvT [Psychrobacter sp. Urea-trap-16]MBA6319176.1 glycine cleavage system aminomethyltransferase GcvT [Psychrobacter sp. Urea-trap-20]MBA6333840.1 glycine cleavage system aminomethyltransferase GcvT [Psychrobacter sp. Urea-trap-19]OEH67015.1 MAG: glycine cl